MRTDRIKEADWPRYLADFLATDDRADFTVVIDFWHTELQNTAFESFQNKLSPSGAPWLPWEWQSDGTRSRNPTGHPTLDATGTLRMSLYRKGRDNIDIVEPRSGMYGTAVPYAGLHNEGGTVTLDEKLYHRTNAIKPKKAGGTMKVSQREFLDVTPEMADALANAVADFIVEQLEG